MRFIQIVLDIPDLSEHDFDVGPAVAFQVSQELFCDTVNVEASSEAIYVYAIMRGFDFFAHLSEAFQLESRRWLAVASYCLQQKKNYQGFIRNFKSCFRAA